MDRLERYEKTIAEERAWQIGHAAVREPQFELPATHAEEAAVVVGVTTRAEIDAAIDNLLTYPRPMV
jgi:hypothetical protein